eukprot:CAMPEP_0185030316 /NCGR_PEP_ID=MMETSP1103-20130426/17211_1 /TAXON_ID=36769 /ORGANISM="Paraphysomonas bandaiensis, Strain Caron Lab Isolate" /LENGTH=311 /DNA_ID=CAMNT_0027565395 /DNA_START=25 /DNA_END=960 /DNA_ORIENTATION=+
MSNIGMMDGAFFVGRKEIVDWINQTLQINISKVEQTCSGAIACQLLDVMYPDKVPMHKVNWGAKQEFEYIQNYKVLQTCFTKLHIDRHVDVDRLIKGRYQDNLEFMQWFKRFFELSVQDIGDYDAPGRRARGKGGAQYNSSSLGRATGGSSAGEKSRGRIAAPPARPNPTKPPVGEKKAKLATSSSAPSTARDIPAQPTESAVVVDTASQEEIARLTSEVERLSAAQEDMQAEMTGVEKERDFYFEKLREIEMLLQDLEEKGEGTELTGKIFDILYATAEGFQPADDVVEPEGVENMEIPEPAQEGAEETY